LLKAEAKPSTLERTSNCRVPPELRRIPKSSEVISIVVPAVAVSENSMYFDKLIDPKNVLDPLVAPVFQPVNISLPVPEL